MDTRAEGALAIPDVRSWSLAVGGSPVVPASCAVVTIPVAAAIIWRDGLVLLCRRPAGKRHAGLFEFPGGKLLPDESLSDGIRRELLEELGVGVVNVGSIRHSVQDPGSEFLIHFVEVTITGEPRAIEHEELRWVELGEIRALPLAPSDASFAACVERGDITFSTSDAD